MDGLLLVTQGPKGSKGDLPIGISQNRSPRITCFFFGVFKVEKTVSFRNHVTYRSRCFLHGKYTEHMQISGDLAVATFAAIFWS